MCGIIGLSRAPRSSIPNARPFLIDGLRVIEHRGHHATGAGWSLDRDVEYVHYSNMAGRASNVATRLPIPKQGIVAAIGHTRHATLGSPTVAENNHPVVHEHIVAVHNGVIDNHRDLLDLIGVTNPAEVDSFAVPALLASLDVLGADHATEALSLLEGCAAVAWLDAAENHVLHLARVATRPLAIGWTRRGDLVFASTPQALRSWGLRSDVNIRYIEEVSEGTYLRVDRGTITEQRTFDVIRPRWVRPDDAPTTRVISSRRDRGALEAVRSQPRLPAFDTDWWDEFDRTERPIVTDDGIDWGNLAPRRGWKDV